LKHNILVCELDQIKQTVSCVAVHLCELLAD